MRPIKLRVAAPICCIAIDYDRRLLATRAHCDDAIVLLGIERVEPQSFPVRRVFELDHRPVFLEPLVDQGEVATADSILDKVRRGRVTLDAITN